MKDGFGKFYNTIFTFILFSSLGIQLCFTAGAPLFKYLIDPEYYSGIYLIPVLTLSAIAIMLSALIGIIFTATMQSKLFLYSSIVTLVVTVLANFLLIPIYGIIGAAVATAIGSFSEMFLRNVFVRKYIRLTDCRRYLTAMTGFCLLLFSFYYINSKIISGLLYGIVFCFIAVYFYGQWNKIKSFFKLGKEG